MVIKMKNNKQKKQKHKKDKKVLKVLDLILIIVGISTFIFTTIMLIYFALFQAIPDTLCERFYTVIVGELGITGVIQVAKTIWGKNNKTDNVDDINFDNEIEIENELESEDIDNGNG